MTTLFAMQRMVRIGAKVGEECGPARRVHKHRRWRWTAQLGWLAAAISLAGCQPSGSNSSEPDPASSLAYSDARSASDILEWMKGAYANCQTYSDQASLHLTYRLQGQLMEEHHPWHVSFQRPNRLAASLFNARLRSDGDRLSCFIYDFASGNLDDQHLLVPVEQNIPLDYVVSDSIARYFVTGQSELPLDGKIESARRGLFPPTLKLLSREPDLDWWSQQDCYRLPDHKVNDAPCYRIEMQHDGLSFVLSIDQSTGLLRQVEFPVELLDSRLMQSDEITELRLWAAFHDAQFKLPADPPSFQVQWSESANVVDQFVTVPEKFPCKWVGKSLRGLRIDDMGGFPVSAEEWQGRITALFWMDEMVARSLSDEIIQMAGEVPDDSYHFAVVLFGGLKDNKSIAELVANDIQVLMDPEFKIGTAIGLQVTPAVVVLDRNGLVQFTQHLAPGGSDTDSTDWQAKLAVALKRIRNGEDLAKEMRDQYQLFLEQYQRRLAEANPLQDAAQKRVATDRFFDLKPKWQSNSVQLPGNIVAGIPQSNAFLVCEGFQSVSALNLEGQRIGQWQLPIDAGDSVSVLRAHKLPSGSHTFAGFGMLGPHATVFDDEFNRVARLPAPSNQLKVVDAAWFPTEESPRLGLAFHNESKLAIGELDGAPSRMIALPRPIKSIASLPGQRTASNRASANFVACLRNGQLVAGSTNSNPQIIDHPNHSAKWVSSRRSSTLGGTNGKTKTVAARNWVDSKLGAAGHRQRRTDARTAYVVVGADRDGQFLATAYNRYHERRWSIPVTSQLHQNAIQPIAHVPSTPFAGGLWAVAGSDAKVTLISDDGRFADTMDIGFVPSGIGVLEKQGTPHLVVSGENGIHCWKISTPAHSN